MTNSWPPPYIIRRHPLAKYIKLRISKTDGLVVSLPPRTSIKHIPDVLLKHREWIISRLAAIPTIAVQELPAEINFRAFNEVWTLSYIKTPDKIKLYTRIHLKQFVLSGIVENAACFSLLRKWIRKMADHYLTHELKNISEEINLPFNMVTIRNQKTLWGSCSSKANINLNYKLIFLPLHLARHIIIHELCHTVHLNHSQKFWQLVAKHDAEWQHNKQQMRHADQYIPAWL